MSTWLRGRDFQEFALAFAAGAALSLASLANFLSYNMYPYHRMEVGLIALGLLSVSFLVPFCYRSQRQWGRSFLEGLLVALFVDLNTDSFPLVVGAGLGAAAITAWRKFSLLGTMAILGSVVLLTTVVGAGGRSSWIATIKADEARRSANSYGKPAIVHIILDEHLGPEGLLNEGTEGQRLSKELQAYYITSGFALYGGAYSRHYRTVNAIPDMLNYGERLGHGGSRRRVETGPTNYLQALVSQGYRLTIFQPDIADYCSGATFHECMTYDSFSPRATLAVPMENQERAALILLKFLATSDIFRRTSQGWNSAAIVARRMGVSVPQSPPNPEHSSTVGTLEAMNLLLERVKLARPGDAFFAHLLMPHFPYVVRRDCSYLPWTAWDSLESQSTIHVKRRAYYEQVRCATRRIATVLRTLSQSPAGKNAVLIVHGDHGSRLVRVPPNEENFGRISDADMIAGFSTLFAIRAPSIRPGYFTERQPVPTLLKGFAMSGFRVAPHPKSPQMPTVYLADKNWKPIRQVPLPVSWGGADAPTEGKKITR